MLWGEKEEVRETKERRTAKRSSPGVWKKNLEENTHLLLLLLMIFAY